MQGSVDDDLALSIVAPVYNEAGILLELVARCTRAAQQSGLPFELVIVDDASTDDTPTVLAGLGPDTHVQQCRLQTNLGQFRATQAGLRQARGRWVVVLDGDRQDPPEHIPRLLEALSAAAPSVVAVLAVKSHRDDPFVFMLGQFVFHRLQYALSRVPLPRGAGSYCLMQREVARQVAMAELRRPHLAAVFAVAARALGGELAVVPYDKGPRYDRSPRVRWPRLVAGAGGVAGGDGGAVPTHGVDGVRSGSDRVGGSRLPDGALGDARGKRVRRWLVAVGGPSNTTCACHDARAARSRLRPRGRRLLHGARRRAGRALRRQPGLPRARAAANA